MSEGSAWSEAKRAPWSGGPRSVPAAIALTLLALLTTPARADWPQFRGEPSQQGIADSDLPASPVPVWTFRVPEGAETTPAIVDGRVYLGSLGGTFHALDLATGKSLWQYELPETPEVKSSALVWDGTVYFGDEYGTLHALDTASGTKRWSFEAGGAFTGSPTRLIAGDARCVVAGSYDNSIYCLDPVSGDKKWRQETEGYVHGTPAVSEDGRVVSSGCDGYLRVVRADGSEASELQVGSYVAASPALVDGSVFVGNFDNEVMRIDLARGEVAWRYRHPERAFPFYSSPAVVDGVVVVGGRDKMVHAIDAAKGTARWIHNMRARVEASPVIVGDSAARRVVVADSSGLLRLLELADGSVAWEFEAGDGFAGSPAVADGYLVIASLDGTVYAFADASKRPASRQPAP